MGAVVIIDYLLPSSTECTRVIKSIVYIVVL